MQPFDTDIGEDKEHSSSFLYLSVPLFAMRELWLSVRARSWPEVEGTVQTSTRTIGGTRETMRVEVWYGFAFQGKHYAGRLVRDGFLGVGRVVKKYPVGQKVLVRVNPEKPEESYLPSGMSYIEPAIIGVFSFGALALVLGLLVSFILIAMGH